MLRAGAVFSCPRVARVRRQPQENHSRWCRLATLPLPDEPGEGANDDPSRPKINKDAAARVVRAGTNNGGKRRSSKGQGMLLQRGKGARTCRRRAPAFSPCHGIHRLRLAVFSCRHTETEEGEENRQRQEGEKGQEGQKVEQGHTDCDHRDDPGMDGDDASSTYTFFYKRPRCLPRLVVDRGARAAWRCCPMPQTLSIGYSLVNGRNKEDEAEAVEDCHLGSVLDQSLKQHAA